MSPVSSTIRDERLIITIDHPPVNALSHSVRAGIVDALAATGDDGIDSVIIHCKGRTFFSGADISEFGKPTRSPGLADVIRAIEDCPKPVIAAIHGQALGGGLELALACDYRVMDVRAKAGLPEVNLGLIPGAGGTQRLPRLVGLDKALSIAVTGKPVDAETAQEYGLVDLVSRGDLLEEAIGLSHHGDRQKRRLCDMEAPECDPSILDKWREHAAKRMRGQDAPLAVIAAAETGCSTSVQDGLKAEREHFTRLMSGSQSRAMRQLFFAERQAGKLVDPIEAEPVDLQFIGVVGAGTMGVGIAAAMLAAGFRVVMFDARPDLLSIGHDRVQAIIDGDHKKGRIDAATHKQRTSSLSRVKDWDGFRDCDLVIEAVFEDLAVKQSVLASLDAAVRPDTLIASNTSYLDIDTLADGVSHPGRVLGLHFFSPAHIMKLLEIVRGRKTSDTALASALMLAKRARKVGVVSGVCHGFIGNRMLSGYGREAGLLVLEGASPAQVDAALHAFGMPMGPFAMGDMAGLDIGDANRKKLDPGLFEARAFQVHDQLVEMGRKGQKTGSGFYRYEGTSRTPLNDPASDEVIEAVRRREGITPRDISDEEIIERCMFALVNEGAHLLGEGIAQRGSDIDVVYANGYGFPRWRGGPFTYADEVGLDRVVARIGEFAEQHGSRWWHPAPLLVELAGTGASLSQYVPSRKTEPAE